VPDEPTDELISLLEAHRRTAHRLEHRAAILGGEPLLELGDQESLALARSEIARISAALAAAGRPPAALAGASPLTGPARRPAPPPASQRAVPATMPFVVGRALDATEPIFGRDQVFQMIEGFLATGQSVNLVGERRIGKTSVLNHLLGNPTCIPRADDGRPELRLGFLTLQNEVADEPAFYGRALLALLEHTPAGRNAAADALLLQPGGLNGPAEAREARTGRITTGFRRPARRPGRPASRGRTPPGPCGAVTNWRRRAVMSRPRRYSRPRRPMSCPPGRAQAGCGAHCTGPPGICRSGSDAVCSGLARPLATWRPG
jgi:hypothetical protein